MHNHASIPRYSVVIPCYNSGQSLASLLDRMDSVFRERVQVPNGVAPYEVLLVEDGSPNQSTWPMLQELARTRPQVTLIKLTRNFGQHRALLCGMAHARGEFIFTMDDDGQHRPEDIPNFIALESHDIVLGHFREKYHGTSKQFTSRIVSWLTAKLTGKPDGVASSPFRLIRRPIVEAILKFGTPFPFIEAMLFYVSRDVVNAEAEHAPRAEGTTTYTFRKLFRLFLNLVISNSSLLLRMVGYGGLMIAGLSFLGGLFVVARVVFFGSAVAGWASTMAALCFFGGAILFSLGVIGEYLWRIICSTEHRPVFVVREIITSEEKP